jgi:hypothetical protein
MIDGALTRSSSEQGEMHLMAPLAHHRLRLSAVHRGSRSSGR